MDEMVSDDYWPALHEFPPVATEPLEEGLTWLPFGSTDIQMLSDAQRILVTTWMALNAEHDMLPLLLVLVLGAFMAVLVMQFRFRHYIRIVKGK